LNVPLRIGFDLDGVLADMESELARQAEILFGEDVTRRSDPASSEAADAAMSATKTADTETERDSAPALAHLDLPSRQRRRLWHRVASIDNFWEQLQEIEPGAVKWLADAAIDRRWEVIFLTSRPETAGDSAQAQSHRWLVAHGFSAPSVFVVHGSRGKIASALNLHVVVDDRPENCLDVAIDSSARAVLVWRGDEDKVPGSARQLGIGAVPSIGECLDILETLDDADAEQPGMVDRLKRLLGLKPRAARQRGVARPEPARDAASSTGAAVPTR